MNREIEFRAYIKSENILINVPIIDFRKSAECIRTVYGQTNASEWKYRFDDIILMQYTGLKDKNGKKIFEGDIVKNTLVLENNTFATNIDIVEFNQEDCSFMLGKGKRHFNKNLDLEVIGNIYENNLESKGE